MEELTTLARPVAGFKGYVPGMGRGDGKIGKEGKRQEKGRARG